VWRRICDGKESYPDDIHVARRETGSC
jgi:hypothetical protein